MVVLSDDSAFLVECDVDGPFHFVLSIFAQGTLRLLSARLNFVATFCEMPTLAANSALCAAAAMSLA